MSARWTEAEDDILREYYPAEGTEVIHRLEGRTKQAIWLRAMKLKINVKPEIISRNISLHMNNGDNKYNGWTDEEKAILASEYANNKGRMHELLPRHTERACTVRASSENLTYPKVKWSEEELALMRENKEKHASELLPLFPGRTLNAISIKLMRIRKEAKEL